MCLQRYGLDTKRNFWRRYDDVYPKVQIHFHFYSKSAIKNALEQVLGPFTSNPEQVKKNKFLGYWKIPGPPPGNFQAPTRDSLPPGKFQDPLLENSRTQPVTRSWIFLSTIHRHLSQSRFRWENLLRDNPLLLLNPRTAEAFHIKAQIIKSFLRTPKSSHVEIPPFHSHFHKFGSFQHN